MTTNYYLDNYQSGCARDVRGPYRSIGEARSSVEGEVQVEVEPYEGVLIQLRSMGEVEMVEAWAKTADSEDYQAIYAVTPH